jgi:hypothetical protein
MLNIIEEFIKESKSKELDTESLEELYNKLLLGEDVEDEIEQEMERLLNQAEPERPLLAAQYSWARKSEYMPKPIETSVGKVYALPDKFSTVTLRSEPQEEEFENLDYQDSIEKEQWEAKDALDRKGRVSRPIDLRNYPDLFMGDGKIAGACDVAGTGEDSSVITIRMGIHVVDVQVYPFSDEMQTCGYIVQAIQEWGPEYFNIDCTGGWGAGVYARLMEMEIDAVCEIRPIYFQAAPVDDTRRPENVRAEMFLNLQQQFMKGLVTLPPNDEELCKEIVYVRYEPVSKGTFKIVDKKIIKKELGHSPDRADCVAMVFYDPQAMFAYFT